MPIEPALTTPAHGGLAFEPRYGAADGRVKGAQAHWLPRPLTNEAEAAALARAACLEWSGWIEEETRSLQLSLDAWPLSATVEAFGELILEVVSDASIDARRITVICRESQLRRELQTAANVLGKLKSAGLRIELLLDEPDQGYSSFLCLRCLPIDRINIPVSALDEGLQTTERLSVLRTIIGMARGLHLDVLASGIKEPAQTQLIDKLGVDECQGPAFSGLQDAKNFRKQVAAPSTRSAGLPPAASPERTLLLVDDEENILAALRRLFRPDGYRILTATSAAAGLERLRESKVDVIISDQRMPGMTGVDFLRRAKALYPDTMRLTLSGYADLQSIIDAVNEGSVYKFLTKPWEDERLRAHVAEAFRQKEMSDENRRLNEEVADGNAELAHLNERMARMLLQQQEQASLMAASAEGVHALLDDLPVALIGIDPEGLLAYANRSAKDLLGLDALSPGLPISEPIAALCTRLAPAGPDQPTRCEVNQRSCLAWQRELRGTNDVPRGVMLTLLPWPEARSLP